MTLSFMTFVASGLQDPSRPGHLRTTPPVIGRVAHCLPGQMRTMCSPFMYENYRKNAIDPVGAPSDVFLVLEESDKGALEGRHRIPECDTALQRLGVKHVTYTNVKRIQKWETCKADIENAETAGGFRYTHVIKARPDLLIASPVPALQKFPTAGKMWVLPYLESADSLKMVGELSEGSQTWYHDFLTRDHGKLQNHFGVNDMFFITDRLSADYILVANSLRAKRAEEESAQDWHLHASRMHCGKHANDDECALKMAATSHDVKIQYLSFAIRILRPCGWKTGMDRGKEFNSVCLWDLAANSSSAEEALTAVRRYRPLQCPQFQGYVKPSEKVEVMERCGGTWKI